MDRMASTRWKNWPSMDLLSKEDQLQRPTMGSCFGPQVTRLQSGLPSESPRISERGFWDTEANTVSMNWNSDVNVCVPAFVLGVIHSGEMYHWSVYHSRVMLSRASSLVKRSMDSQ